MKTDKVLGILIILAFVLLGGVYAQFMAQDQATAKNIKAIKDKVDGFDGAIKKIESQAQSNADSIKDIVGKAGANDAQNKDIASKLEGMAKEIQQLQDDVKEVIALKEVKVSEVPPAATVVPEPAAPTDEAKPEATPAAEQPEATEQVLQP